MRPAYELHPERAGRQDRGHARGHKTSRPHSHLPAFGSGSGKRSFLGSLQALKDQLQALRPACMDPEEPQSPLENAPIAAQPMGPHEHDSDSRVSGSPEQAIIYSLAVLGLLSNLLLVSLVLGQRHTRRLTSAFLLHSAFLNLIMSFLAFAFGSGLSRDGVSGSSCRSLTIAYIVFQTVWVFNLIPTACCELFHLDSGRGRPGGSVCCAAFGVCLVYICSAIIHLGPTLIGSNFEQRAGTARCLFLHGHLKNYTVYLMWILIVTIALGVTAYLLFAFRRAIDGSMRSRLRLTVLPSSGPAASAEAAVALLRADPVLAARLGDLADRKTNRQRVLCGVCGVFVLCWYPLYFLVLSDPGNKAPVALYHAFTALGFAKAVIEPLTVAACDRSVGRVVMRLLPCTRRLRYVSECEIDQRLAASAAASCPERSDSTSAIASGSSNAGSRRSQHQQQLQQHQQQPELHHQSLPHGLYSSSTVSFGDS